LARFSITVATATSSAAVVFDMIVPSIVFAVAMLAPAAGE
jgi:hypothetical protein